MKPSNLVSPRCLADATFTTGYSSSFSYRRRTKAWAAIGWIVVTVFSLACFLAVAV